MNREQIIRIAVSVYGTQFTEQDLHFAALVAAAEREECAKLCESLFDPDDDSCNEADVCAAAIRARGQQ